MKQRVIDTALKGEAVTVNQRKDGVTYQTVGRGRVTVLDRGRVNVTGALMGKVSHLGGTEYRHGLSWS